ncbi:MAG: major facilitator transporter [Herbaspirillum sp.]|jgi:EmrB/QacA subfamily drug resistance transporter|nr:major facilitator transporter [Herbaspirillum sp.]
MAISRTLLIPLIVACALFMEQIDSTVIATSLPVLAVDMGVDPVALKLALTAYMVSLAVFIPISGWMADRFGARTVFRSAIGVFMLGSILCGICVTMPQFVAARFFQGIGGAMMVPVGRLVVLRSVQKSELVKALSYLTMPAMLGPVLGPPLGGFITTYFHWRWIFFINIPISILGVYLATRFIDNLKAESVKPLDWVGFVLSAAGCSLLMLGLATTGRHMISGEASTACMAIGALSLMTYVWHARRTPYPLIDLRLLQVRTLQISLISGSLFRVGIGALPFLLPLMLQIGFGFTAFHSGLLTCASAFGAVFVKTIAARILKRFGFRRVMVMNAIVGAAVTGAVGAFGPTTPVALMFGVLLFGGCFRSIQFTSANALAYADIGTKDMSQATSIASVAQQLSIGLGVTIAGLALQATMDLQGTAKLTSHDFWPAFLVVAAISASSVFVNMRLVPGDGAELAGRKPKVANQAA